MRIEEIRKASAVQLAEARDPRPVARHLLEIDRELIAWLAAHPENMHHLSPRKFEEVVAEILKDQGHSVELTPETRDGGRDTIAVMKTPLSEILVIIECKKWAADRKVGVDVLERFIYTIRERNKANQGIIVTSTTFSADAAKAANQYKYLLKLKDAEAFREMAENYGTWREKSGSGLWVPKY